MRFILVAVLTVLCACAPAPAPAVVEPTPTPVELPAPKRDYDVLLEVSPSLEVRARLFPDAPVVAIEVLAFTSADAAPTTAWRATQGGDAAAIAAGTSVMLGALPSGWVEDAPFVAPVAGTTWVVTLAAADGTGRSTRFLTDTRVRPTLQIDRGAGLIVVGTTPSVPVSRVTLSALDGGALWEGRAPVPEGVTLPAGGLVVGDAPSTWDARRFPTAGNLVSGERYHLEVAIPGDPQVDAVVLSQDVLFLGGAQPVLQPLQDQPTSTPAFTGNGGTYGGRIFEIGTGSVFAFQSVTSPYNTTDPLTYVLSPVGTGGWTRPFLDLTPMTPNTGPAFATPMNLMRTLWAMSRPVLFDTRRVGVAAVYSTNRTTPGQLMVVERVPGSSITAPPNGVPSWDDGWKLVGAPLGPTVAATAELSTYLSRGLVSGLPQSLDRPWIVSLTNRTKVTDFTFAYLDTTGAWVTLSAAGLAPAGNTLVGVYRMRHVVGSDGALYAFAVVRSNTAANAVVTEFVLARLSVGTNSWERLNAAPGSLWQGTDEETSFSLAEQGGVLAATSIVSLPNNNSGHYVLRRAAGVVKDAVLPMASFDPVPGRLVRVRDMAVDARGQVLLLSTAKQLIGDQYGRISALISVLSQDSVGVGVARVVESPLPEYMPIAPDVGWVSTLDLAFAPQGRAVLGLTSGYRAQSYNNGSLYTHVSMFWRMPMP